MSDIPLFKGSAVAMLTPFNEKGINYQEVEKLIEFHIKNKTDALVICGTTGEPSTMTEAEKAELIGFCIKKINKRIPAIIGTGGNNTAEVIHASAAAEKAGADGLLIVTPYYNKVTQNGLVIHYHEIANSVGIPIIVYNVPARTNVNVLPETLARIAEHKNIGAVKEASGDLSQAAEYSRLCRGKLDLYTGDDPTIVPFLSIGGIGVISVVGNIIPKRTHDLVMSFLNGDIRHACDEQLALMPLIKAMFCEVNPIPVKAAAELMGLCGGKLRLPLTRIESAGLEKVKKAMSDLKLI